MQDLICQAIREKRLLELHYAGQARRVAPHVYGIDAMGDELLSCYEVWGGSDGEPAGWRSLRLAQISALTLTSKRFAPRPEHQRSEGAIARVVLPGVKQNLSPRRQARQVRNSEISEFLPWRAWRLGETFIWS